jgi:hypothetical protein
MQPVAASHTAAEFKKFGDLEFGDCPKMKAQT